jgi:hypothetical protein
MYGLVNKSVEELVCGKFGEEAWQEIKRRAGVDEEYFISNQSYPDQITYRLVTAASEVLKVAPEVVLEMFGEHWILKTARENYGPLLLAGGKTLPAFLTNLPNFHTRVSLMFPNLQPPRFALSEVGPESLRLHYHTHRDGLAPFVKGILTGLAQLFETQVQITQVVRRGEGSDHDVFEIRWGMSVE